MNNIVPTIGRIVIYNTTEAERKILKNQGCNEQTQLPALIVSVWGDQPGSAVNLRVTVDGPNPSDFWKTSLSHGTANEAGVYPEGSWNFPVIK